ncbi:MAG: FAD synthetase family protein [Patescibacteria group bacterium]
MVIIDQLRELSRLRLSARSIVTIGTFDGVHLGHRYLLNRVISQAKQKNLNSILITFDQHPAEFLNPNTGVTILSSLAEKKYLLSELKPDYLVFLPFENIFNCTPELFIHDTLLSLCKLQKLIVGEDFHFGKHRLGNVDMLKQLSTINNFELEVLFRIKNSSDFISSSLVRNLIKKGELNKANSVLGYNYLVQGVVCESKDKVTQVAIKNTNKLLPEFGLYEVKIINFSENFQANLYKAEIRDGWQVISLRGNLPTFGLSSNIQLEFLNKK